VNVTITLPGEAKVSVECTLEELPQVVHAVKLGTRAYYRPPKPPPTTGPT
jgi:hypothetical protein